MRYFLLQIKKVCKALPFLLITTLALTAILGLLALAQTKGVQADEGRQKIRLGIVGDSEDAFVQSGISLLQEMDSSRFTCTIEEMTESEARQALENQKINGYLIIPEDFVRSVMSGEGNFCYRHRTVWPGNYAGKRTGGCGIHFADRNTVRYLCVHPFRPAGGGDGIPGRADSPDEFPVF